MTTNCEHCAPKGRTIVNYILDESGSMMGVADAAISGFNEYVGDLRKSDDENTLLSLTKFESTTTVVHTMTPLSDVPDLCTHSYKPNGMTALYDAIGQTVRAIEGQVTKDDRVLCVIMTDGHENSSKEFNQQGIKSLIESKEKEGNWTFVYLGANQDAFAVGSTLGVQAGNTLNYQATRGGHRSAMKSVALATASYSASNVQATNDFFAGDPADLKPTNDVHLSSSSESDVKLTLSK